MKVNVVIPQQGLTIEYVTINEWLVKEGDLVKKDDLIFSIESEKAILVVPSPSDGKILNLLKEEGEEAVVGEVVALIESPD